MVVARRADACKKRQDPQHRCASDRLDLVVACPDLGVACLDLGVACLDPGVACLDLGVACHGLGAVCLDLGVRRNSRCSIEAIAGGSQGLRFS